MYELAESVLRKTDTAIFRIDLIGSVTATMLDGTSLLPVGAKTRGVLAVLAMADRKPVSRKLLAGLLWSQRPDEQARASLRQEIHRLTEALKPLGADAIDVQRHTLALRPVLTSVDVERYLYASGAALLKLPEIDARLMENLDGIDPAFDVWLSEQRDHFRRQLIGRFEAGLQTLTDSTLRAGMTARLLKLDQENEVAWCEYITTGFANGDGRRVADECTHTYRVILKQEPGAGILNLIASLQAEGAVSDVVPAKEQVGSSRKPVSLPRLSSEHDPAGSDYAFSVVVATPEIAGNADVPAGVEDLLTDSTMAGLLGAGFARVMLECEQVSSDYVVRIKIRQPVKGAHDLGGRMNVMMNIQDMKQGGAVIWGQRFAVLPDELESLCFRVASENLWRMMFASARRIAPRKIETLTSVEIALRALALLIRGDCQSQIESEAILREVLEKSPENSSIYFVWTVNRLVAVWDIGKFAGEEAIKAARAFVDRVPESGIGRLLLACALLWFGERRDEGFALVRGAEMMAPFQPELLPVQACEALISGEFERATELMRRFREEAAAHPLLVLFYPFFALALILSKAHDDALMYGRMAVAMAPSRTSCLLMLFMVLAIKVETDPSVEEDLVDIRTRLLHRHPGFSCADVAERISFLPAESVNYLLQVVARAGLPA